MTERTILVVGEETEESKVREKVRFGRDDTVVVTDVDPTSGDRLRGYSADIVILTTDLDDEVIRNVIRPMVAIRDGSIIRL